MPINRPHQRYLDTLFAKAEDGRYPSHQILARIESAITDRETAERYVDLLMNEAEKQRYPSLLMIDRAYGVMTRTAVADTIARIQDELDDQ